MAGTSAPPVPHCRDLTLVGERLASRLYIADSDRLGHRVTVTVYPALADEDARRRFDRAAASAHRLATHPSVLTIHDWGHGADGRPWVVTDPQPPETIDTLLRVEGPRPIEQALRIGVLVAGALETSHRAGIVHGDLSPARLVLGPQGEPLVADMGLAEFSDFPGLGALHSPIRYFAPPEVLERTGVSPASDVYSLATTVYALLAGGAPHEKPADITDSNASLLLRILQIEVPPIVRPGEDIDGVEAALRPALAHATQKRPPRVLDLARSLQAVQRNLGIAVVEPVVLDLGSPGHPTAVSPAAEPGAPPAAPPEPEVPPGYAGSQPNPPGTSGTELVHLFSDTPPDFTDRAHGPTTRHWATGLGHVAGPANAAGYDNHVGEVQPRPPDEPRPMEPRRPMEPSRPMEPYPPDDPYPPDEPHPPAAATTDASAPANGSRPNRYTQEPLTGTPPVGLNGRGNGLRPAPMAGGDDEPGPVRRPPIDASRRRDPQGRPAQHPNARGGDDAQRPVTGLRVPVDADTPPTARGSSAVPRIVPRGRAPGEQDTRPGRSPGSGGRRRVSGPEGPRPGASPAAERTRTGSALARAREARMRRYAWSVGDEPEPGQPAAAPPRDQGRSPASGGAPAVPVIVLIVVVVLLTLGVAYMVITGDGTSDPVDDQPGASTPSVPMSARVDSAGRVAVCQAPDTCGVHDPRNRPSFDQA